MNSNTKDWAADVKTSTYKMVFTGLTIAFIFSGGFFYWATQAPLAGAAVAPGIVSAAGLNQSVQHLEGGILRKILVQEGDTAKIGQALFELDPTAASTRLNRLQNQIISLVSRAAQLISERDGKDVLTYDGALVADAAKAGATELLDERKREFATRLKRHHQEVSIAHQRIQGLNEQISGISAQQTAVEQQLKIVQQEAARKKELLDKGLTNRSEFTALLRSEADLIGQQGRAKAQILSAKAQIIEAKEQLARLQTQRVETAVSELNTIRSQIADTSQQLAEAQSILSRTIVRSPSNGIVVKINYNSLGGVVKPGETMLELLPTGQDLIVEARLLPQDIDLVSIGQHAKLNFSALNMRTTPTIDATVFYISADRIIDPTTNEAYYTARLRITDDLPPEMDKTKIYPGMPVETFIQTGERTFFEYLAKPIFDSFNRAFREE